MIRHFPFNLLHSERPKLHTILAFLSATGLNGLVTQNSNHCTGLMVCGSTNHVVKERQSL